MDPNENTEATEDVAAEQTLSPSETNGDSSSESAVETPETSEEAIRREFLEKYGSDEGEETSTDDGEEDAEAESKADTDTPEAAQKSETDIQSDDDEDGEFRIPDEEFKGLPQGVKQRIGHLNTRAKKAEREKSELEQQITPLKDAHDRFTTLQNYVQEHDIQPQNVTLAFDAMAKMSRGDFQGFIDAIKPFYDHAMQAAGAAISPDLQQRVDDGYLTEEDARELTKARMQTETYKGQAQQLRERDSQRVQQERQGQQVNDMLSAINNREAQLKASDPDYALKSQAMRSAIQFALESGAVPKTSDDAINMVNRAYENVSANFVKPAPPRATPPRPSASTPSRGRSEPATTKDAITQSLRDFSA